jgi:hypothetical protein
MDLHELAPLRSHRLDQVEAHLPHLAGIRVGVFLLGLADQARRGLLLAPLTFSARKILVIAATGCSRSEPMAIQLL